MAGPTATAQASGSSGAVSAEQQQQQAELVLRAITQVSAFHASCGPITMAVYYSMESAGSTRLREAV
jgi:hypothetical protein